MTARSSGKYVGHQVAELKPEVDIVRLQEAWQKVSERASVLRTRIVDLPGQGLVQVVLKEALQWQAFSSLNEYHQRRKNAGKELQEDVVETTAMGLGTPLSRLAIVHDEATGKRYLALTHHHATYNGWSVPLLQKEVDKAYKDGEVELASLPLQSFVKYVMKQHGEYGMAFWKRQIC
jgi:hypothetical protein